MKTTKFFKNAGNEAAPTVSRREMPSMTLWVVARETRQIVCRPHAVTGAVRVSTGPWVPRELLARTISIAGDMEDSACR
jgi:hypothetical protein